MPIYAYKCDACGHAKDVLQKVSDPLLTTCPACGAEAFSKQLTAAGFQLKGSGWYATDFRGGNNAPKPEGEAGEKAAADKAVEKDPQKVADKAAVKAVAAPVGDKPATAPAAAPPSAAPAPSAPAPSTASPPSSGG